MGRRLEKQTELKGVPMIHATLVIRDSGSHILLNKSIEGHAVMPVLETARLLIDGWFDTVSDKQAFSFSSINIDISKR